MLPRSVTGPDSGYFTLFHLLTPLCKACCGATAKVMAVTIKQMIIVINDICNISLHTKKRGSERFIREEHSENTTLPRLFKTLDLLVEAREFHLAVLYKTTLFSQLKTKPDNQEQRDADIGCRYAVPVDPIRQEGLIVLA